MTRPRPRLKGSESQSRDRDRDHKNIETKTKVVETIKDETSKFGSRLISENLSRPRLIETEKFYRCRDRDSSRPGNFIDVETETYRDWEILRLSRPRPIETGQKMSRPRLYRESRWSLHQSYFQFLPYGSVHYGSACAHFIEKTFFLQSGSYYTHFCRQMPRKSMAKTRNYLNQQEIRFWPI